MNIPEKCWIGQNLVVGPPWQVHGVVSWMGFDEWRETMKAQVSRVFNL